MTITLLYDDADFLPFEIAFEADRDGTISSRASLISSFIHCVIFALLLRDLTRALCRSGIQESDYRP